MHNLAAHSLPVWAAGANAELLATGPITVIMLALHHRLLPRQITGELANRSSAVSQLGVIRKAW